MAKHYKNLLSGAVAEVPHVKKLLKDTKRASDQEKAHSLADHIIDQKRIEEMHDAQREIALHDRDEHDLGRVDTEARDRARERLADLQAERLENQAQRSKSQGWRPSEAEIEEFLLRSRPNLKLRPNIPVISIPKNSTAQKEYAKNSARVDALRASMRGAEVAFLTEKEAGVKAVEIVYKLADQGAPDFTGLFRYSKPHASVRPQQGGISWPTAYIGGDFHNAGFAFTVWLHRDAVAERVLKEVATLARPDKALSVADRTAKIAGLKVQLLEAERLEHAAFLLAVKDDPTLKCRRVDLRAYLQIEESPIPVPEDVEDFG